MRLLLDTHVILWMIRDDPKLIPAAREAISTADEILWSMVSLWEIAIKVSLDRPDFRLADDWAKRIPDEMAHNGFRSLPLKPDHLEILSKLPFHHRDPFDRILISTAISENLAIITEDRKFHNYPVEVFW